MNRLIILLVFALVMMGYLLGGCQPIVAPEAANTVASDSVSLPPTEKASTETELAPATASPAEESTPEPTPARSFKFTNVTESIESQALAGNLLGDPAKRDFIVMLPPGYEESDQRYPVVYVLHGYLLEDEKSNVTTFGIFMRGLLKSGEADEMIFVFVDGTNQLGGSMYLSSPTIGDYETYIAQEIVGQVDADYRTLAQPQSRGITGCSMGGDGAMLLALKHPDVFGLTAPNSASYDWSQEPWLINDARQAYAKPVEDIAGLDRSPMSVKYALALAAALLPNPDKPSLYLDQPYEIIDGEAQFPSGYLELLRDASPTGAAERYLEQPARLSNILLFHGEYDDVAPVGLARIFSKHLTDLGIEHELLEERAGHCAAAWTPVLQFLADNLVFEEE